MLKGFPFHKALHTFDYSLRLDQARSLLVRPRIGDEIICLTVAFSSEVLQMQNLERIVNSNNVNKHF